MSPSTKPLRLSGVRAMGTDLRRVIAWFVSGDTGASSETIAAHMCGVEPNGAYFCAPSDPSDLGRCLRLLELFPEWKARMPEMVEYGPEWSALVSCWDKLASLMDHEAGIDWSKGSRAPKTYAAMRDAIAKATADGERGEA